MIVPASSMATYEAMPSRSASHEPLPTLGVVEGPFRADPATLGGHPLGQITHTRVIVARHRAADAEAGHADRLPSPFLSVPLNRVAPM